MIHQIPVYVIEKNGRATDKAIDNIVGEKSALCLYTPAELPPSYPLPSSPLIEVKEDIGVELMFTSAAYNACGYDAQEVTAITPLYAVPRDHVFLLAVHLARNGLEKTIETCQLTLDNDLSHTKEAAYQIAIKMEEKKGGVKFREKERQERVDRTDEAARTEFMYFLPSAQRAREREDRRWSSYEYGRRMRSLARR